MPTCNYKKIDLKADYPCPCCRRGTLSLITLTDALACERCQEIFVIQENGYVLEGLKTAYPYPKKWCWTGYQWNRHSSSQPWGNLLTPVVRFTIITLLFSVLAVLIGITISLLPNLPYAWWGIIVGLLAVFLIILWNTFQE